MASKDPLAGESISYFPAQSNTSFLLVGGDCRQNLAVSSGCQPFECVQDMRSMKRSGICHQAHLALYNWRGTEGTGTWLPSNSWRGVVTRYPLFSQIATVWD